MTYNRIALLLASLAMAVGALVPIGWALNLTVLKSVFPGMVSMTPNTASGILLCGAALALLSRQKTAAPARFWVTVMAVVVIAVGALTLSEYLFGWEPGIDRWLFRGAQSSIALPWPGRMAPASAFCFMLTGVSLAVAALPLSMRLRISLLAALGLNVIVVNGLVLTSSASDVMFHVRWWTYTGMALHTALGFMFLGFGLLALGASQGKLQWSLDARTSGGFVVGIVALLAAAGMSYQFTEQLENSAQWVSHTQDVLKNIGDVLIGVVSLASSQRSFVSTGNAAFEEQSERIKDAIRTKIDVLRKLTADIGFGHRDHSLPEPLHCPLAAGSANARAAAPFSGGIATDRGGSGRTTRGTATSRNHGGGAFL